MHLAYHHKSRKTNLHVFSTKVKDVICEEIRKSKFYIVADEACYESSKEQMVVQCSGLLTMKVFFVNFCFAFVHVSDTEALTLKESIYSILSHHTLNIQNIRGEGYNGASNK